MKTVYKRALVASVKTNTLFMVLSAKQGDKPAQTTIFSVAITANRFIDAICDGSPISLSESQKEDFYIVSAPEIITEHDYCIVPFYDFNPEIIENIKKRYNHY